MDCGLDQIGETVNVHLQKVILQQCQQSSEFESTIGHSRLFRKKSKNPYFSCCGPATIWLHNYSYLGTFLQFNHEYLFMGYMQMQNFRLQTIRILNVPPRVCIKHTQHSFTKCFQHDTVYLVKYFPHQSILCIDPSTEGL